MRVPCVILDNHLMCDAVHVNYKLYWNRNAYILLVCIYCCMYMYLSLCMFIDIWICISKMYMLYVSVSISLSLYALYAIYIYI